MTKSKWFPHVIGGLAALLFAAGYVYLVCPAIHIQNPGLWTLVALTVLVYLIVSRLLGLASDAISIVRRDGHRVQLSFGGKGKLFLIPLAIFVLMGLGALIGGEMFNAKSYANVLTVTESDFATDLSESVGTDSIALMDTASAQMLGDREIGSLSHVVSQYNVADAYTQIDYQGKPIKVAPLEYAGFFKWTSNRQNGATGYVTVDPVSMSASFVECDGMKYIPSAYFGEDAVRRMWSQFPTLMLENLHFEIDEEGKPY